MLVFFSILFLAYQEKSGAYLHLVGVAGFEPAAHWSQTSCATKLRYTPRILNWQGQKDSNPRHAVLETAALPAELYPYMAEKARFELARP